MSRFDETNLNRGANILSTRRRVSAELILSRVSSQDIRHSFPYQIHVRFMPTTGFDDAAIAAVDCRDYVATHVLARQLLAEIAGCMPNQIEARSEPGKRPEVTAPALAQRISFSLSHADGYALCAAGLGLGLPFEQIFISGSGTGQRSHSAAHGLSRHHYRSGKKIRTTC